MTIQQLRNHVLTTVDPRSDARWAALVDRTPYASLFHAPPWLRAVANTYGLTPQATILGDEETAVAGLAHVRIEDARGARLITNPFSDFCDPLADTAGEWQALTSALLSDRAPYTMRIRHSAWPLQDERLHAEEIGTWHAVDISADEETQWAQLGGSSRRNIRHAQQAGVVVEVSADPTQLREFFDLHRQVRKYKYRLLAQPWAFFEQLHEQFAPNGRLHVLLARVHGHAVGGILAIAWGDSLYYKFNASALDELDVRPNDLLAWESINLARRLSLARLDFGFSDGDQPGLIRYKRKFATVESAVHKLTREGDPVPESARRLGRDLGALTALLTDERVPDDVTEAAGSLLYHYFA